MSHEQGMETYQEIHSNRNKLPESWKQVHNIIYFDKEPSLAWTYFNFLRPMCKLISYD